MDKINIENLSNYKTQNNPNRTLDVKTVIQSNKTFNITSLLLVREKKRKQLLEYYNSFHRQCLRKIEAVNKLGKTDLLYTVDIQVPNCPEYKPLDCIEFIKKKLEQDSFDTCVVNNNTLFITWLYLEVNKEKTVRHNSP
jgi:hypothetical protein